MRQTFIRSAFTPSNINTTTSIQSTTSIVLAVSAALLMTDTSAHAASERPTESAAAATIKLNQATTRFDLPAQPLADSLRAIAAATNSNIIFDRELVRGLEAKPLRAELSVGAALAELLKGTELAVLNVDANTAMIVAKREKGGERTSAPPLAADSNRLAQNGNTPPNTQWAPAAETVDRTTVEEIIVTAQKRQERLQDVPISITAMKGERLDSSNDQGVGDALRAVPAVAVSAETFGGGTQVVIRGAAPASDMLGGASPVAYYLDTVPFGFTRHAFGPDMNVYDLNRVEVLRGPQGTLYGANALSGVVRILTNDADLSEFDIKGRTALSSTAGGGISYRGDMAVNVPIVEDKLAVRAVVGYQHVGGWVDKPFADKRNVNDGNIRSARIKINAKPSENFSVALSAWSSDDNFNAPPVSESSGTQLSQAPQPMSSEFKAYGLKLDYEFPMVTVSSMTSYLDFRNQGNLDVGYGSPPFEILTTTHKSKVFAEELLLNSRIQGPWRWSAGAFYRDNKDGRISDFPAAFPVPTDFNDISKSWALFGEVGRQFLNDRLGFAWGLRRFHDDVDTVVNSYWTGVAIPKQSFSFNATTQRLVLNWKANPDLTIYGSYSQGFRSGVGQDPFASAVVPNIPPLRPDKLNNYEVGAKGYLWDRLVMFDAAVFYMDWKQTQQMFVIPVSGNVFASALVNGTGASGPGAEFSISSQPLQGLDLNVNFSWNDLTFDQDVYSAGVLLFPKGQRLNDSVKYTAGASADYAFPIGGQGLQGGVSISGNYSSKRAGVLLAGPGTVGAYAGDNVMLMKLGLSIKSPTKWRGSLFVDNLANKNVLLTPSNGGFSDWAIYARPRTIGVQLEYGLR